MERYNATMSAKDIEKGLKKFDYLPVAELMADLLHGLNSNLYDEQHDDRAGNGDADRTARIIYDLLPTAQRLLEHLNESASIDVETAKTMIDACVKAGCFQDAIKDAFKLVQHLELRIKQLAAAIPNPKKLILIKEYLDLSDGLCKMDSSQMRHDLKRWVNSIKELPNG